MRSAAAELAFGEMMKMILGMVLVVLCSLSGVAEEKQPKITEFAFGGIGYGGITSSGERVFQRLYASPKPLEAFKKFYAEQEGNNEAQMYALVAFYDLDRAAYERIKSECRGKGVRVICMHGCLGSVSDLDSLMKEIESGQYAIYIPKTPADPIDALTRRLNSDIGGLWVNGEYPLIPLSSNATPQEVVASAIVQHGFDNGHIKTHQILEVRKISLKAKPNCSAALIESDLGRKILLFQYEGEKIGWWTRFYDAPVRAER